MEEIPLLLALLIISGFFSATEIALFSLGSERIHAIKKDATKKQKKRIQRLETLKSSPNQLLVTILIGNNIANVAASSMATIVALQIAQDMGAGQNTGSLIGIVTGIMTFLILVFGEITPKALANKHALAFSLFAAPVIRFLQILLTPLVLPLAKVVSKITKEEEISQALSENELKAAIHLSEKEGEIEHEERELFEKVLEFDEHIVDDIMTPRSKIFMLPHDQTLKEALPLIKEQKFSRIPIYKETEDDIIGILTTHSLIKTLSEPKAKQKQIQELLLKEPFKIPPTMRINTLLKQFQAQKTSHMAMVYDEHGGLIGLITLEDILEEVFGEIHDETDEATYSIKRVKKNLFSCNPDVELEHIEDFVRKRFPKKEIEHFPWELDDENKTLNYFLLEKLERFPKVGEKVEIKNEEIGFLFTVKKVEEQKIEIVEFTVIG